MRHRKLRLDMNDYVGLSWHGLSTPASIENISMGGALLRADLPVKKGEFMAVYLEDDAWPENLEVGGEVIRTGQIRRGMPAFAVKFSIIPKNLRMFLNNVMTDQIVFKHS